MVTEGYGGLLWVTLVTKDYGEFLRVTSCNLHELPRVMKGS